MNCTFKQIIIFIVQPADIICDIDCISSVLRDTFGAMCAESGMKIDVMCEIMGISANECERYFPKNTEENQSPLEFLREAY